MTGVGVRPATLADIPVITRIYGHSVRTGHASWEWEAPDEAEMTRRFETLIAGGYPYLVAALDGAVVGYAYAGPFKPRRAYAWAVENSVYVDPDTGRRGIGRLLMEALIAACTQGGFRQMLAVISGDENSPSVRFHASLGFEKVGAIPHFGWKFETWQSLVLMQRALGAGAATPPQEMPHG